MRAGAYLTGLYGWANFGLWTAVLGALWLAMWPFDRDRRAMARALRFCWGHAHRWTNPFWRVRREGFVPGAGPYVVVVNHQSFTDVPNVLAAIPPARVVARDMVFKVPLAGWFVSLSRQVHADRFEVEAAEALRQGLSVLVFPEGTRSPDGHLQRFRNGAFEIARTAGVPVLPIVSFGSGDVAKKGTYMPRHAVHRVRLTVMEPVDPAPFPSTPELKAAVHQAMKRVLEGS